MSNNTTQTTSRGTQANATPHAKQLLTVLTQLAPAQGKLFKLQKDRIVLGSMVTCDVQLQGEGVSPLHAVIEVGYNSAGQPQATLFDLASDTGTFVNSSKQVTCSIKSGDEIMLGRYKLKFTLEDLQTLSQEVKAQKTRSDEDLRPLILEDERNVVEIFDYRPASKTALEVVYSWKATILDVKHFVDETEVTISSDHRGDFATPPVIQSGAKYAIAQRSGEGFNVQLDPSMSGVIQKAGQLLTLDQVRGMGQTQLVIGRNEFAKVSTGGIDFYFSYTAAPPKLKSQSLMERDPFFNKLVALSFVSTGILAYLATQIQLPQQIEVEQLPERLATILYQPPQPTPPKAPEIKKVEKAPEEAVKPKEPEPTKTVKIDLKPTEVKPTVVPEKMKVAETPKNTGPSVKAESEAKEGAGARAKGAEGSRGSKTAAKGKTPQDAAKRPSPQAGDGSGGGNSQVQDQGNVDLLKGAATAVQNILGNTADKLGKGGKELQGFGNFSTYGNGGKALSGTGKGGGGDAEGLGGLSDRGRGGGRVGTGLGAAGNGTGIIGGRTRVALRTGGAEEAIVNGSIDRNAIYAAILAHKDEFRFCYEDAINKPGVDKSAIGGGTVKTTFTIGSSGRVDEAGVENSTLDNGAVEGCVVKVLKRIQFPIPEGAGAVQVTFPFKFDTMK